MMVIIIEAKLERELFGKRFVFDERERDRQLGAFVVLRGGRGERKWVGDS